MATISAYRGKLYLLGRFPAKDGSDQLKQTRIATGLEDTPANRRVAEKQLKKLERELKAGTFDWGDWSVNGRIGGPTWRDAIDALYKKKVVLGRTKESTWEVNYMGRLKRLNPGSEVSSTSIREAIEFYERETYSYKLMYYLMKDIAMLLGVRFPEVGLPTYTQENTALKKVPNDDEIIEWVLSAGPAHQWCFGMMATYGLRPHEVPLCTQIEDGYVQVPQNTKTGFRTVVPLYRDWIETFDLANRVQPPEAVLTSGRPDACAVWLNTRRVAMKLPWTPYALRHAYAGRLWRSGGAQLDPFTAARLMGHSLKEHIKTYRAFVDPNQIAVQAEAAFEANKLRTTEQVFAALGQGPRR